MIIAETGVFTRRITQLMRDEDYRLLQMCLMRNPETGRLIPGSGGLRKVRWQLAGRGKRSGMRVIYYWVRGREVILMLLVYSKNEQDDLSWEQMKGLGRLVEEEFK